MTNLDSILKRRDITLLTKVHLVKAVVFPVVMYRCESWTIKKDEHWRIDAFEVWCWRRLFKVLWTARRFNQSILKEISPEYSLERLMVKLNLQYFGHLMGRTDLLERPWCWERLKVGGEGNNRGWDGWMASLTRWTWVWKTLLVGDEEGSLAFYSPWGHKESDITEQLNWPAVNQYHIWWRCWFPTINLEIPQARQSLKRQRQLLRPSIVYSLIQASFPTWDDKKYNKGLVLRTRTLQY